MAHQAGLLRSTRLLLQGHQARAALPLRIKASSKAVTRTQVPTKTTLRISTFGLKGTRCLSKGSSINLIHRGPIIHLTYQMSTEDTPVETCRRTTPVDRICTVDTAAVSSLLVIQRERRRMQEVTAIHPRRRHIQLLCHSKRPPASPLRLPSLQLLRLILVLKTTTDRNRADTELPQGHRYTRAVRVQTRICHRRRRVRTRLDVTLTLPKTNSILSIINNDQRIQDGQIQPVSTTVVVGTIGFSIHLSNRSRRRSSNSRRRRSKRHRSALSPLRPRQEGSLAVSSGVVNSQIEHRRNQH